MTDAERMEENIRLGSDSTNRKELVAYKFMQRYYHKGAFFRDEATANNPIFQRDYNMPVGEDKMDKSVLPAVLQKRRG
jgi:microfibrillar-associated protein 1